MIVDRGVNKTWFQRMRGGTQLKMEKEGTQKSVARDKVRKKGTMTERHKYKNTKNSDELR